jgi:hypothetical protein
MSIIGPPRYHHPRARTIPNHDPGAEPDYARGNWEIVSGMSAPTNAEGR